MKKEDISKDELSPEAKALLRKIEEAHQKDALERMVYLSDSLQRSLPGDDDATHTFHEMMYQITSILKEIKQGQDPKQFFSAEYIAEKCDILKGWAKMYYEERPRAK